MSSIRLENVSVEIPIYNGVDRSLKINLFRSTGAAKILRYGAAFRGRPEGKA